jgi:hypothetical protein
VGNLYYFAFCTKNAKDFKKVLTTFVVYGIILNVAGKKNKHFGFPDADVALGSIAQLGEHLPYKQGVTGSIPVVPTNTAR